MARPPSQHYRACALRGLRLTVLLLAALPAGGCAGTSFQQYLDNNLKLGPNFHRPYGPVADEWIEADAPRVLPEGMQYPQWWSVFEDPALDELIAVAYAQNLDLKVAVTRVLEARAQWAIAVGNFFPQSQQALGGYSRTANSKNIANNSANLLPLFSTTQGVPARELPTNYYSLFDNGFNLSWELDFWGRYRRNIESADANLRGTIKDFDSVLVTLLADVGTNYIKYRVAQQRIKIALANADVQAKVVKISERRFKIGTATRLDIEQARTILEKTRSSIPAFEIVQGQANDTLCTLLGVAPVDLQPILGEGPRLGSIPTPRIPETVAAGIPADLLRRRPDVRAAECRVAAQSARIGIAESDLYPAISVNGTIGYQAQQLGLLYQPDSVVGAVAPGFTWNILNYGRLINNVRLQEARLKQQIIEYQNTVLTASRETQIALRSFLKSQEQTELLQKSVDAAIAATKIGVQQWQVGTHDLNRVFILETTQVVQQDALAVAQGDIATNLINVYRALGGGWELRCEKGIPRLNGPRTLPAPTPAGSDDPEPETVPSPEADDEHALPAPEPAGAEDGGDGMGDLLPKELMKE